LEECRSDNLEELNIDDLQDVMVNLEESDIFYNKFMYNIVNPVENPVTTRIFQNMDDRDPGIDRDSMGRFSVENNFTFPQELVHQFEPWWMWLPVTSRSMLQRFEIGTVALF